MPPRNYYEIQNRADKSIWLQAYQKELFAFEKVGQMETVPRPKHKTVIPILELFSWKVDQISEEKIAKVRIVAQGNRVPGSHK